MTRASGRNLARTPLLFTNKEIVLKKLNKTIKTTFVVVIVYCCCFFKK